MPRSMPKEASGSLWLVGTRLLQALQLKRWHNLGAAGLNTMLLQGNHSLTLLTWWVLNMSNLLHNIFLILF